MCIDSYLTNCKPKIKDTGFLRLFISLLASPKVWFWIPIFNQLPLVKSFQVLRSYTICMLMTPRHIWQWNSDSSMAELSECLFPLQEWTNRVKLKLNLDKIEFVIIGDKHTRKSQTSKFPVTFLQSFITMTEELKYLGVFVVACHNFSVVPRVLLLGHVACQCYSKYKTTCQQKWVWQ